MNKDVVRCDECGKDITNQTQYLWKREWICEDCNLEIEE